MVAWPSIKLHYVCMASLSLWTAWRARNSELIILFFDMVPCCPVVALPLVLVLWNCYCDLMSGINPHTWVVSPGCALLAGCRCGPWHCDDMPHDALMWGRGEDLVDRSRT